MKQFAYPAKITEGEDGFFLVKFIDIPYAATDGETVLEALESAPDCLAEALSAMMVHGEDIPDPSKIRKGAMQKLIPVPAQIAVKVALYRAMKDQKMGSSGLAIKLGVDEKEARRLLDPHHASKLPRMADALSALGSQLVIGVES